MTAYNLIYREGKKLCSKCGEYKKPSEYNLRLGRARSECRECQRINDQQYQRQKTEKRRAARIAYKFPYALRVGCEYCPFRERCEKNIAESFALRELFGYYPSDVVLVACEADSPHRQEWETIRGD